MQQITKELINWVKGYFADNGNGYAVIGISGGKDSTIVAAVLKEAIGSDKIIAVMMPCGEQSDISDSYAVCDHLGIPKCNRLEVNIGDAFMNLKNEIICGGTVDLMNNRADMVVNNPIINTNLPSRLRMCTLYSVAAMYPNARVVNTSNASERYIGYSTKWGDGVGDFSPLGNLTVREVLQIGDDLGLPYPLVHKTPSDGMSGKSDEEKIGFTYEELDDFLLGIREPDVDTKGKIMRLHTVNKHKTSPMPMFVSEEWKDEK